MVGDLEKVHPRDATGQDDRIDPLLDVAREQESPSIDLAEQDDRDVVDARPGVGWL